MPTATARAGSICFVTSTVKNAHRLRQAYQQGWLLQTEFMSRLHSCQQMHVLFPFLHGRVSSSTPSLQVRSLAARVLPSVREMAKDAVPRPTFEERRRALPSRLLVAGVPEHGDAGRRHAYHNGVFGMRHREVLLGGLPEGALESRA